VVKTVKSTGLLASIGLCLVIRAAILHFLKIIFPDNQSLNQIYLSELGLVW